MPIMDNGWGTEIAAATAGQGTEILVLKEGPSPEQ
jgi:hypothetical protein